MKLSISKISEFEKCPYSFYLSHIRKEKIGVIPSQLTEGNEKHKVFETVIHQAQEIAKNEKISKASAIKKAIIQSAHYEKYKKDCNNFVELSERIEEKGGNPFPEHREIQLYDKELNLGGIIDRVDTEGNNILILDYKTGKEHPISNYYFQLAVYAYIYEKNFGKKVTHWGIFFSNNGILLKEPVIPEEIDFSVAKIKNARILIDESIEKKDFPKKPSALCKWCVWFQNNKCDGKKTPPQISVI